jgi:lantibiotic modifying enzyme
MSKTSIALINAVVLTLAVLILGVAYYLFGHHNRTLSRSYFLEKEIRNLYYIETHEVVSSYDDVARRYREILNVIRFEEPSEELDQKYEQAIVRAELKAKICRFLDDYSDQQNREALSAAHDLFTSIDYALLEHRWWFVYHRSVFVDEEWFKNQMGLPNKP